MRHIAQREDIRDLILDAVDVLLARYGYKKMTMEDLAQQVGIGKGTIYLHFSTKEEAVLSHVDRIIDRLLQELHTIAASEDPITLRLQKMLITRVVFRVDSVSGYSQSLNDLLSSLRPSFLARRRIHFAKEAEVFVAILKEGKDAGTFFAQDLKATAQALLSATNSLLPFSLSVKELGKRKSIEKMTREIVNLLLKGLTKKTRAAKRRSLVSVKR
jgi:AcrR family transcriptional regulator